MRHNNAFSDNNKLEMQASVQKIFIISTYFWKKWSSETLIRPVLICNRNQRVASHGAKALQPCL